jgi:microcystin-dependent protein
MALPFYNWSQTAGSNATADSTVNWAEGMAPSAVNDSARAMMASTAAFRDDISGAIATGGTSTAYTVSSYEVFDTLAHLGGKMIAFTPHATNGATVTLNVDGLGAKPLRPSPSVELPAGVLIQGTPYVALYNNSDAVFYLHGFYTSPYQIPIGGFMPFVSSTAPNSSFVLPYGQAISRTTYATLFSLVGTTFGSGDGSTTFNIPDLRGRVVAGLGNMGGSDAGRLTSTYFGANGTTIGAAAGSESHTLSTAEIPSHNHTATDSGHTHPFGAGNSTNAGFNVQIGGTQGVPYNPFGSSGAFAGSNGSGTANITVGNNGGGGAHAIVQPTIVLPYILRVI